MTPAATALLQALEHHGGAPDFHLWLHDLRERLEVVEREAVLASPTTDAVRGFITGHLRDGRPYRGGMLGESLREVEG